MPQTRLNLALFLVVRSAVWTKSFHVLPERSTTRRSACLPMGLYEEDIEWDADLFGQVGKSNDDRSVDGGSQTKTGDGGGALDDGKWDMGPPSAPNKNDTFTRGQRSGSKALDDNNWDMGSQSNSKNDVQALREQMNTAWGREDMENKEGKPTADWMPGFRTGPEEDEPWFTG